jgi:hypothetical protein
MTGVIPLQGETAGAVWLQLRAGRLPTRDDGAPKSNEQGSFLDYAAKCCIII